MPAYSAARACLNDAARACRVQPVLKPNSLRKWGVSMMQHARAECSARSAIVAFTTSRLNDAARACRVQREISTAGVRMVACLNDAARACRVQHRQAALEMFTVRVSMMQHARAECSHLGGVQDVVASGSQ